MGWAAGETEAAWKEGAGAGVWVKAKRAGWGGSG